MTTYPAPNPPMIPARHQGGRQTPKAIVIHGTVSSDNAGTARRIANWWAGPTSPVTSCHYTVDPREVIQSVGDHRIAFHCGSNANCIGIELCDEQAGPANRWQDADSQAIIRRAARLTAELCLAYDIQPIRPTIAALKSKGKHGIYGHNDSRQAFGGTSHTDPRDFPWSQFLRLVREEIAKIKEPDVPISYPALPKGRIAFWNMNNGRRDGIYEALDALRNSGARLIALTECSGHWPVIRQWAKDRGFSVRTGTGDLGSAGGMLIKHRSNHKGYGHKTVLEDWVGPQGGEIAGRTIYFEKSESAGRREMVIGFHQVWGPNRPKNAAAKREIVEELRRIIQDNPAYDIYIGPDWNESSNSTEPFSPRGTTNLFDGIILTTGEPVDYIVYIPARTGEQAQRPIAPRARAGSSKMGSDHKPVIV